MSSKRRAGESRRVLLRRRPLSAGFRAGTLDDPTSVAPDVHIYTRSKLPWVAILESAPAFTTYFDMQKLWPAASLERLEALRRRPRGT